MVESSKILTVSYGTFSCTLEGFDDSFSTMKAIAEYFRDLAAGDRYFGAEPPTPDADMLTRIAEREISRRVDVTSSDTGIVLRASEPAPRPAVAPPAPAVAETSTAAPAAAPRAQPVADIKTSPEAADVAKLDATGSEQDVTEAEPTMPPVQRPPESRDAARRKVRSMADDVDVAFDKVEDAPMPQPRVTQAPAHPDANSVAAKLQRIRAVVGGVAPSPATTFAEDLEDENADEQVAIASAIAEPRPAEDVASDAADESGTAQSEDTAADQLANESSAPAMSDAETDDAIDRASVDFSAQDQDADTAGNNQADSDEVVAEDTYEAANSAGDETDDQIDTVLRNLQRAGLRQSKPVSEPSDTAADTAQADEVSPDASTDRAGDSTVPESLAEQEAAPTAPTATRGRILRVTRRAVTSVSATVETSSEPTATASAKTPEPVSKDAAAKDVAQHEVDHWPHDPALKDDAADDAPAAPEAASAAKLDGADDLTEFDGDTADSTLSPEDEADLQRELAEVSEDRGNDTDADAASTVAEEDAAAPEADDKPRRDPLPGTSEAEMSRIMSQADEELANPEGNRRRSAIAHLKAAVAATEAARQLGEPGSDRAEQENTFRSDLDQVVRPRRAERLAPGAERPRPAPLKLVASQRIDVAPDASDTPVQPRRVAKADTPDVADIGNFAEFAEAMGATGLQDLLEAAAAYAAFVEGSEDFSRPHIMEKVRQTVTEDFSREDGLRSFGTLLRQGRIERVRNGRFAVSERTRFRPEAIATGS